MDVKWSKFKKPDGTEYQQIEVSDSSDWDLFNRLAEVLEKELQGQWIEKLDGLDQRYWDLNAKEGRITLHLEHYLGITVYPFDQENASPESLSLLNEAYDVLSAYRPA